MHSIIQRIATGPELSKDISQDEARDGMLAILHGEIDDVQTAIFLIALRMKRETNEENKGVLEAILRHSLNCQANVEELVSLADPYDGMNRNLPVAPMIPAILAACGLPCISHGLDAVGPKFGVTHRHVLEAAGIDVNMGLKEAKNRLEDPRIGWAYLDQKVFCPGLHDLTQLRQRIIKRQVLTTVEVLAKPISAKHKTHLVTGYVHKPYPAKYATLARFAQFQSCLLIRGTEGGVVPSLRQSSMMFRYQDLGEEEAIEITPASLAIDQSVRAVPLPEHLLQSHNSDEGVSIADVSQTAQWAADTGRRALQGEKGPAYDSLVYASALILWHTGRHDTLQSAAQQIRSILDSGQAAARIE
jgi:anthranilate phosphoribosyltransferase